jgi:thiol-disulfide isomerase/thioredoxin
MATPETDGMAPSSVHTQVIIAKSDTRNSDMQLTRHLLTVLALGWLVLAACGRDGSTVNAAKPPATAPAGGSVTSTATSTGGGGTSAPLAPWQTLTLTDTAGRPFTLADFVGRPVFVENFATWCPNCRQQLGDTNAAATTAGDNAVFLALSTETNLSAQTVAEYASDNHFDHVRFAVMTPEFLAAIADAYGNSAVNPPSTPHLVVDALGHPGQLTTGFSSPEEIATALTRAAA